MKTDSIKNVLVLGTGNMGPGIALLFARAFYSVTMWGPTKRDRKDGIYNFKRNVDDMVQEGFLENSLADEINSRITVTTDLKDAAGDAHLIVEAIPEQLELKQQMFAKLEELCSSHTIFASNTSTLLPSALSHKMSHKERLLVAHFWNPAYLAPLVEVCGSPCTSKEVIDTTMIILRKIGKEPVLIRKEILGFIGNRIMHAMNREALALIGNGVCTPEDIDKVVLSSFGPRFANLGPMEYLDFVGLDLIKSIQAYLYADLDTTPGLLPVIDKLFSEGNLGIKSGKGLYDWSKKENKIRAKRDLEFIRRRNRNIRKFNI
jgi:3-hydroxybutyryl-CoA dehydrogenase